MIIREYKSGDEISITELFIISSPRHLRIPAYWEWSNLRNPYRKSLSLVTEEDNKIIAHYSVIPLRMSVDKLIVVGGFGQQAVVHPSFRNLKIIMDLTNKVWIKASERFEFIFGFPNDNFWKINQMLMGWKKVDEFFADIINIPTVVEILKHNPFQRFIVKRINKFPLEINKWLNNNRKSRIYPLKSAELLNWRFSDHPLHYYFIFGVYDDRAMVGYMVLKIYWDGKQVIGHFIDFDVKNNKKEYLISLIEQVSLFLMRCRISSIIFWNYQSEYFDVFNQLNVKKGGFKTNFGIKFLNNKIQKENKILLDISQWNFTMAFSDAF